MYLYEIEYDKSARSVMGRSGIITKTPEGTKRIPRLETPVIMKRLG